MSFFKSLCLAIIATLFITFVLGYSVLELFDLDLVIDGQHIEPLKAISVSALVAVLLIFVALAIVLSVFGTMIFVGIVVVGSLAMVAIGIFWPILLVALVIYLITKDNNKQPSY